MCIRCSNIVFASKPPIMTLQDVHGCHNYHHCSSGQRFWRVSFNHHYRATLCVSAIFAVVRCPCVCLSVCLSRWCIVSTELIIIITRKMYWRRASIQDGQAPGDATVLKRFFRDNFLIFRCRSKTIVFFESVNFSTCVHMQIFNFRDGHVTTFRHHSGAYIYQMPGHRLSRLAKGTPSASQLSVCIIGWSKTVSCRLWAGQSIGT